MPPLSVESAGVLDDTAQRAAAALIFVACPGFP
jgi:hypothetical protein